MSVLSFIKKLYSPTPSEKGNPEYLRQGCYEIAYQIGPRTIFRKSEAFDDMWFQKRDQLGTFFYDFWCGGVGRKSELSLKNQFLVHSAAVGEWDCGIIEYPRFSQRLVNLDEVQLDPTKLPIPVPCFSAIMRRDGNRETRYMLLGHSMANPGTNLRTLLPDGSNCNLGSGPEATIEAFLSTLRAPARPFE
jgi:hypothetical protein